MSNARNLSKLTPNVSGQLPDTNIAQISTSKLNGLLPRVNAPSGSVIQIQSFFSTTQWSSAAGRYPGASTGMAVSITPTSSTSKILILGTIYGSVTSSTSVCDFYLNRSGTAIGPGASYTNDSASPGFYVNGGSDQAWITLPLFFYDSPATTSSLTYTLYAQSGNGGTVYLNRRSDSWSAGPTQILAMEIQG